MRPVEIEAWALRVIEALGKRAPTEDVQVELKAGWPDPKKAARQIAGHANAAHGEAILWLIGVDEKAGVVGAQREELSKWWPQVESHFDGLAPRLVDLNIPVSGLTVVGLLMETDRAPFVVNNPAANMDKEVPWREGTRVRSARRADLVRLLEPLEKLPEIDLLWGYCVLRSLGFFTACMFVTPPRDRRIVLPVHRCAVAVSGEAGEGSVPVSDVRLLEQRESGRFDAERTEVVIDDPRKIGIQGELDPNLARNLQTKPLRVTLDLKPAGFQNAATCREFLPWCEENKCWELTRIEWARLDEYFYVFA